MAGEIVLHRIFNANAKISQYEPKYKNAVFQLFLKAYE